MLLSVSSCINAALSLLNFEIFNLLQQYKIKSFHLLATLKKTVKQKAGKQCDVLPKCQTHLGRRFHQLSMFRTFLFQKAA